MPPVNRAATFFHLFHVQQLMYTIYGLLKPNLTLYITPHVRYKIQGTSETKDSPIRIRCLVRARHCRHQSGRNPVLLLFFLQVPQTGGRDLFRF